MYLIVVTFIYDNLYRVVFIQQSSGKKSCFSLLMIAI